MNISDRYEMTKAGLTYLIEIRGFIDEQVVVRFVFENGGYDYYCISKERAEVNIKNGWWVKL